MTAFEIDIMPRISYSGRALAAAIVVAALLAPAAAAQANSAKPSSVELTITLMPDGTASATVYQTWIGASARSIRQSLDVYFGAGDGELTEPEVVKIADATQEDMLGEKLPWISSDGVQWVVSTAKVSFDGAPGSATSTNSLSMRHELTLATGQSSTPGTVDIDAPWAATLKVETPEGRIIEGGAPATIPENQRTTLRVVEPPAPPPVVEEPPPAPVVEETPAPAPVSEPDRLLMQIGLGVGALFLLGALGVGAWLYMGGRKKRAAT